MEINLKGLTQEQLDDLKRQIAEQEEFNKNPKNEIDYENGYVIHGGGIYKNLGLERAHVEKLNLIGMGRPTKEECEKLLKKLQIHERLRRWSLMCEEKIDWDNENQRKYYCYLDNIINEINISVYSTTINNNIHFTDDSILKRAIEDIGEQNLIDNYFVEV